MTHNSPANTQSVPVKADTAAVFCVIAAIAVLSIFAPEKRPFFVRSPSAQVNGQTLRRYRKNCPLLPSGRTGKLCLPADVLFQV